MDKQPDMLDAIEGLAKALCRDVPADLYLAMSPAAWREIRRGIPPRGFVPLQEVRDYLSDRAGRRG